MTFDAIGLNLAYLFGTTVLAFGMHRYYARKIHFTKIQKYLELQQKEFDRSFEERLQSLEDASIHFDVDGKKYNQLARIIQNDLLNTEKKVTLFEEIDRRLSDRLADFQNRENEMRRLSTELAAQVKTLGEKRDEIRDLAKDLKKARELTTAVEQQNAEAIRKIRDEQAASMKSLSERFEKEAADLAKTQAARLAEMEEIRLRAERRMGEDAARSAEKLSADLAQAQSRERERTEEFVEAEKKRFAEQAARMGDAVALLAKEHERLELRARRLGEEMEEARVAALHAHQSAADQILDATRRKLEETQRALGEDLARRHDELLGRQQALADRLGRTEEEFVLSADEKFKSIQSAIEGYGRRLEEQARDLSERQLTVRAEILASGSEESKKLRGELDQIGSRIKGLEDEARAAFVAFEERQAEARKSLENDETRSKELRARFERDLASLHGDLGERLARLGEELDRLRKQSADLAGEREKDWKGRFERLEAELAERSRIARENFDAGLEARLVDAEKGLEPRVARLEEDTRRALDEFLASERQNLTLALRESSQMLQSEVESSLAEAERLQAVVSDTESRLKELQEEAAHRLEEGLLRAEGALSRFETEEHQAAEERRALQADLTERSRALTEQLSSWETRLAGAREESEALLSELQGKWKERAEAVSQSLAARAEELGVEMGRTLSERLEAAGREVAPALERLASESREALVAFLEKEKDGARTLLKLTLDSLRDEAEEAREHAEEIGTSYHELSRLSAELGAKMHELEAALAERAEAKLETLRVEEGALRDRLDEARRHLDERLAAASEAERRMTELREKTAAEWKEREEIVSERLARMESLVQAEDGRLVEHLARLDEEGERKSRELAERLSADARALEARLGETGESGRAGIEREAELVLERFRAERGEIEGAIARQYETLLAADAASAESREALRLRLEAKHLEVEASFAEIRNLAADELRRAEELRGKTNEDFDRREKALLDELDRKLSVQFDAFAEAEAEAKRRRDESTEKDRDEVRKAAAETLAALETAHREGVLAVERAFGEIRTWEAQAVRLKEELALEEGKRAESLAQAEGALERKANAVGEALSTRGEEMRAAFSRALEERINDLEKGLAPELRRIELQAEGVLQNFLIEQQGVAEERIRESVVSLERAEGQWAAQVQKVEEGIAALDRKSEDAAARLRAFDEALRSQEEIATGRLFSMEKELADRLAEVRAEFETRLAERERSEIERAEKDSRRHADDEARRAELDGRLASLAENLEKLRQEGEKELARLQGEWVAKARDAERELGEKSAELRSSFGSALDERLGDADRGLAAALRRLEEAGQHSVEKQAETLRLRAEAGIGEAESRLGEALRRTETTGQRLEENLARAFDRTEALQAEIRKAESAFDADRIAQVAIERFEHRAKAEEAQLEALIRKVDGERERTLNFLEKEVDSRVQEVEGRILPLEATLLGLENETNRSAEALERRLHDLGKTEIEWRELRDRLDAEFREGAQARGRELSEALEAALDEGRLRLENRLHEAEVASRKRIEEASTVVESRLAEARADVETARAAGRADFDHRLRSVREILSEAREVGEELRSSVAGELQKRIDEVAGTLAGEARKEFSRKSAEILGSLEAQNRAFAESVAKREEELEASVEEWSEKLERSHREVLEEQEALHGEVRSLHDEKTEILRAEWGGALEKEREKQKEMKAAWAKLGAEQRGLAKEIDDLAKKLGKDETRAGEILVRFKARLSDFEKDAVGARAAAQKSMAKIAAGLADDARKELSQQQIGEIRKTVKALESLTADAKKGLETIDREFRLRLEARGKDTDALLARGDEKMEAQGRQFAGELARFQDLVKQVEKDRDELLAGVEGLPVEVRRALDETVERERAHVRQAGLETAREIRNQGEKILTETGRAIIEDLEREKSALRETFGRMTQFLGEDRELFQNRLAQTRSEVEGKLKALVEDAEETVTEIHVKAKAVEALANMGAQGARPIAEEQVNDLRAQLVADFEREFAQFRSQTQVSMREAEARLKELGNRKDVKFEEFQTHLQAEMTRAEKRLGKFAERFEETEKRLEERHEKRFEEFLAKIKLEAEHAVERGEKQQTELEELRLRLDHRGEDLASESRKAIDQSQLTMRRLQEEGGRFRDTLKAAADSFMDEQRRTFEQELASLRERVKGLVNQEQSESGKRQSALEDALASQARRVEAFVGEGEAAAKRASEKLARLEQKFETGLAEALAEHEKEFDERLFEKERKADALVEDLEKRLSVEAEARFKEVNDRLREIGSRLDEFLSHTDLFGKVDKLQEKLAKEAEVASGRMVEVQRIVGELESYQKRFEEFKLHEGDVRAAVERIQGEKRDITRLESNLTGLVKLAQEIHGRLDGVEAARADLQRVEDEIRRRMEEGAGLRKTFEDTLASREKAESMMQELRSALGEAEKVRTAQSGIENRLEGTGALQSKIETRLRELEEKALRLEGQQRQVQDFSDKFDQLGMAVQDVEARHKGLEKLRSDLAVQKEEMTSLKRSIDENIRSYLRLQEEEISKKPAPKRAELGTTPTDMVRTLSKVGWDDEAIASKLKMDVPEVRRILRREG